MSNCDDADLSALVAEQRAANERLLHDGERMPAPGTISVNRLRHAKRFNPDGSEKMQRVERAIDRELQSALGPFRIREFAVADSVGLYVHFHGGGWSLGSIYEQDELLGDLASATRLTVVTIDYPLAPEHPLDEAITQANAAARAVIGTYEHQKVCIGGESAGAHLAVTAALELAREQQYAAKLCGLNLCYGAYDLSMTPSQRLASDAFAGLSKPYLEWFYSLTLPGRSAEERRVPAYSPLYRDLANLPACLFTVGELDPLLDDTLFMAARWRAAGNVTELRVYPQAHHGFNGLGTRMAKLANQRIHRFLEACVGERRS
jgi:acetyl esterase